MATWTQNGHREGDWSSGQEEAPRVRLYELLSLPGCGCSPGDWGVPESSPGQGSLTPGQVELRPKSINVWTRNL